MVFSDENRERKSRGALDKVLGHFWLEAVAAFGTPGRKSLGHPTAHCGSPSEHFAHSLGITCFPVCSYSRPAKSSGE